MMIKYSLITLATLTISLNAYVQQQGAPGGPALAGRKQQVQKDTTSVLYAFKKGQMSGHFRYYFMATDNASGLSDYYANAVGAVLKYETAPFRGFQFGAGGFFVFNIASSDLSKPDPETNQMSRYELALFDVKNPSNKTNIDQVGELYLKYGWKQSSVKFGKQLINTPFINLQDGRMRPTEVNGLYGEINDIKNVKIEAGYLYGISPRSTAKWYKAGESIGVYPMGVNPDGTKSNYSGTLTSKGIAMLGATHTFGNNGSVQIWDVFAENIFNSVLIEANYNYLLRDNSTLLTGAQYIRQDAVNDGGNDDPAKTYFQKGGQSQSFSAKLGWENGYWQTSFNYTRITGQGRYLMPREWGRDPFFTFLPRERNDGLGDVNAYLGKVGYSISKARLKLEAAIGYYDLPDVSNHALNKYGLPSYSQLNLQMGYDYNGILRGLRTELLFVYKRKEGNSYDNDSYVINKVNMISWSMVFHYRF